MKTLAAIKMDKNFIGVLTKGYHQRPYEVLDDQFLLMRIRQETDELEEKLAIPPNPFASAEQNAERIDAVKREIADVSNLLDYMFELVSSFEI